MIRKMSSFFTDLLGKAPVNQDREQLIELQARVERANHFKNLLNHPGFTLLMEDVELHIAALSSRLEEAQTHDDVKKIQVAIKEARFWQTYVDRQVEEGESDLQMLKDLKALANATETA